MKRGINSNNRAQFFILAAVILSVVIIGLAGISNIAKVSKEPEGFYDSAYDIKKESSGVLDWQIYTGFPSNAKLEEFVDKVAKDEIDKDPSLNFAFIYGNYSDLKLRNYGIDTINGVDGGGEEIESRIGGLGVGIDVVNTKGVEGYIQVDIPAEENQRLSIQITANQNFTFTASEYKQVIFIREKQVENETFVDVR